MSTIFEVLFVATDYFLGFKITQLLYWWFNGKLPKKYYKLHPELTPLPIYQMTPKWPSADLSTGWDFNNVNHIDGDGIQTYINFGSSIGAKNEGITEILLKGYMIENAPVGSSTDYIENMDFHSIPGNPFFTRIEDLNSVDKFRIPCSAKDDICFPQFRRMMKTDDNSSIDYQQTANFR